MFILTKIADLVQIEPKDFNKDSSLAIQDNINHKYSNKVIQKIGLCICMYDLLYASDGLIGHGTGLVNVNVEFRMIVFRPFKNEVMVGRISSAKPTGIHIRTKFFNDIWVPFERLPQGTYFNQSENGGLMIWRTDDGAELFFDLHETVRFRVEEEEWTDQAPVGPQGQGQVMEVERKSPYRLIGSMEEPGMGPCLWWDEDEEDPSVPQAMELDA